MSSSVHRKLLPGPRFGSGTRPAHTAWLSVEILTPISFATVLVFLIPMILPFNMDGCLALVP